MSERITSLLADAMRKAAMSAGEQRLFRAGKLDGLFPSRAGAAGAAASQALGEGLLEVVRTEEKGKTRIEWVRLTPRGVDYLHRHDSPAEALGELRDFLRGNREALPGWLMEMRQELERFAAHMEAQAREWSHRFSMLERRIEEALRRAEAVPRAPSGAAPWALDALAYLDQRAARGTCEDCSLPELFAALREHHASLSLSDFHDGLRRLHDRRAIKLLPFAGPAHELPQPEYALLDGPTVLYFAAR